MLSTSTNSNKPSTNQQQPYQDDNDTTPPPAITGEHATPDYDQGLKDFNVESGAKSWDVDGDYSKHIKFNNDIDECT